MCIRDRRPAAVCRGGRPVNVHSDADVRCDQEGSMIDHVGIPVTDLAASRELYATALAPLGYKVLYENEEDGIVGFGAQRPQLWLSRGERKMGVHVALCLLYTSPSPRDGLLSRM